METEYGNRLRRLRVENSADLMQKLSELENYVIEHKVRERGSPCVSCHTFTFLTH